jgi:uncharacterized membrane protein
LTATIGLNSCTIETTKKSNGIKIEISTDDELVINGEKISSKKAEKEIKKLIKELEKEGLNKEEIKLTLNSGKESLQEALDDIKKELEEIKGKKKRNRGEN